MPELFPASKDPNLSLLQDTSDSSKPTTADGEQPPETPPPPPLSSDPEDA